MNFKTVGSLVELVATPLKDGINALCWPRTLPGNFREVVEALPRGEGIVTVDEDQLAGLFLSVAGKVACSILLADLANLRSHNLQPELDCVYGSERQRPKDCSIPMCALGMWTPRPSRPTPS